MSRLKANSTPAERQIGASFAETFTTAQDVLANGGTIKRTSF